MDYQVGDTIVLPAGKGANKATITGFEDGKALIERFKLDGTPVSPQSPNATSIPLTGIAGLWPADNDFRRVLAEYRLRGA